MGIESAWPFGKDREADRYCFGRGQEMGSRRSGLFTAEPGSGAFDRRHIVLKQRRPVKSGRQVLKFVVDRKPAFAGIDPSNFYIDRNSADNVVAVQTGP